MENHEGAAGNTKGKGKGIVKNEYSFWSTDESDLLIQILVYGSTNGWKDKNGCFSKQKVESKILPMLNKKLKCQKSYDNFVSRMKHFRREYQKYSKLMRHSSGFGWDSTTKKFTANEEVWEDYFKAQPTEKSIRTKNLEDYEFLRTIFESNTAVGKNAIGLGDDTDASIYTGEGTQFGMIDDLLYDDFNEVFVPNQTETPFEQSSSHLPLHEIGSEMPNGSTHQKKRNRVEFEGNTNSFESVKKSGAMDSIAVSISSIATNFEAVKSLMEKREKDREAREKERQEKERQSCIWDAVKETQNLDERARYKAMELLNTKIKKDTFLKMTPEERSKWITYNVD